MQVSANMAFASNNVVCDGFSPITDFDGTQYMGTWYQNGEMKKQPFTTGVETCTMAQYYNLDGTTGKFKVDNTAQDPSFGARTGVRGNVVCPDNTGNCFVSFFGKQVPVSNYRVIETDYTSYSVVYSCFEDDQQYLFFLTREPEVPVSNYRVIETDYTSYSVV